MRVVINEAQLNRNRKIAHILFFVSLAGMGFGFFFTWSNPNSSSQLSCLILPILLFMTITSVRMANNWIREPRPQNVLNEALKGLGRKYTLFHYLLPAPHVLIGPEGVFAITTVWQEKSYRIAGKKWLGERGLLQRLTGYLRQDLIGNPFQDAQYHAQQVQRLINKIEPDSGVEVQPLVVFINPKASFEAEDPTIPVLYADSRKKPHLRGYLRDQHAGEHGTLSLEAMDQLDRMYGLITREEIGELGSEEEGEDEEEDLAAETSGREPGTVYILQSGNLYNIGMTRDALDAAIEQVRAESAQPVELLRAIESDDPETMEAFLHRRFDRKRQRGEWFGLSKKDVSWLMSLKGTARTQANTES